MNVWLAIFWKDLVCEWRSRDRLTAMAIFSLLVVVVFHFALPDATRREIGSHAAGLLWVAYLFAALLGLGRTFSSELEHDALGGLALAPVERGWIFLGKALAALLVVLFVQLLAAIAFGLAFGLDLVPSAPGLAAAVPLASLGICFAGTLLSALTARTRARELLLPLLLLPALFPVLSGAVRATSAAIAGEPVPLEALQLLLVVDGIYGVVGFLGFEYVLED